MRDKISACIMSFNEERKIRRCIESVRWCDEIVVLDSFSTDRTQSICEEYTSRFYRQPWAGYVGQRNTVRDLALYPWVLVVDSDEEVSPALRDEILAEFEEGADECVAYEAPRMVYFVGRWIRHGEWYPDVKLRLFKKAYGRAEGEEPHDRIVVNGPVQRLRNPIWHYTYDDLSDQVNTLNRFTTVSSQQLFVRDGRFRWNSLLLRPLFRFLKGYVFKGGFLDGSHGLMVAALSAFGVYLKYAKVWELERRQRDGVDVLPPEDPEQAPGGRGRHAG